MKVYIAHSGFNSEWDRILGIASTRKSASVYKVFDDRDFEIEEWEVDQAVDLLERGLRPFKVSFVIPNRKTDLTDHWVESLFLHEHDHGASHSENDPGRIYNPPHPYGSWATMTFQVVVWAADEEGAVKVAAERRQRALAGRAIP